MQKGSCLKFLKIGLDYNHRKKEQKVSKKRITKEDHDLGSRMCKLKMKYIDSNPILYLDHLDKRVQCHHSQKKIASEAYEPRVF